MLGLLLYVYCIQINRRYYAWASPTCLLHTNKQKILSLGFSYMFIANKLTGDIMLGLLLHVNRRHYAWASPICLLHTN